MLGFGNRPVIITPVTVRPGDDLIVATNDWGAIDDAEPLMRRLQDQFPGVRLHLLIGFGSVQVTGNGRRNGTPGGSNEDAARAPVKRSANRSPVAMAPIAETPDERPAIVLRHSADGRIIVTSFPPEPKCEAVEERQAEGRKRADRFMELWAEAGPKMSAEVQALVKSSGLPNRGRGLRVSFRWLGPIAVVAALFAHRRRVVR